MIAYFAAQARPQANAMPHVSLTDRESEVLLRVAKGYTLPEIGVQLSLSRHTIADYVKQIYRKLNVSSRAEAALEAQRLGPVRAQLLMTAPTLAALRSRLRPRRSPGWVDAATVSAPDDRTPLAACWRRRTRRNC